jgi:hypothetical protein
LFSSSEDPHRHDMKNEGMGSKTKRSKTKQKWVQVRTK